MTLPSIFFVIDGTLSSAIALGSIYVVIVVLITYYCLAFAPICKDRDKAWKWATLIAELCTGVGLVAAFNLFSVVLTNTEIKEYSRQLKSQQELYRNTVSKGTELFCTDSIRNETRNSDAAKLCDHVLRVVSSGVVCTDLHFISNELKPPANLKSQAYQDLRHNIINLVFYSDTICETEGTLNALKATPIIAEINRSPWGYLGVILIIGFGIAIKIAKAARELAKDEPQIAFKDFFRKHCSSKKS